MIRTDDALKLAINLLRDSVESGRMPSGITLDAQASEMHEQAADELETLREQFRGMQPGGLRCRTSPASGRRRL